MKITSLELWRDPGFTDGSVEVPALTGSSLPDPDFSLPAEGSTLSLIPSKDDIFRTIKLAKEYSNLYNMNYLRAVFETGDEETLTFYGWIDSVLISSDTPEYPVTVINWHIDLWRTFAAQAEFGFGMVERRVRQETDPLQNVPYNYRVPGITVSLAFSGLGEESNWVIVNRVVETSGSTQTLTRAMVIPISKDISSAKYILVNNEAVHCPNITDFVNSSFDEKLGIATDTISSVYVSPVPPLEIESGTGTQNDPYVFKTSGTGTETEIIETYAQPQDNYYNSANIVRYTNRTEFRFHNTDGNTVSYSWFITQGIEPTALINFLRNDGNDGQFNVRNQSGSSVIELQEIYRISGANVSFSGVFRDMSVNDWVRLAFGQEFLDDLAAGDTVTFIPYDNSECYYHENAATRSTEVSYGTPELIKLTIDTAGTLISNQEITYGSGGFPGFVVYFNDNSRNFTMKVKSQRSSLYYNVEVEKTSTGYAFAYTTNAAYTEHDQTLSTPVKTTDVSEYLFTDMTGTPTGNVPWGVELQDYKVRNIIGAAEGYIEYRFRGINSHVAGVSYTVPLPKIDITSNSWSSYVYSGQRDYDMSQRKIAAEQALVSGLTGGITGGAQGAMLGGLKEYSDLPRPITFSNGSYDTQRAAANRSSIMHAAGFGALGATAAVSSALLEYVAAQHFNGELQGAEDSVRAKQLDSVIATGGGWDWLWHGRSCCLQQVNIDDYSRTKFQADVALNGIEVSEPTADCSALIAAGGPMRIRELVVRGPIPAEAKQYLKARFANGVRII